MPVIATVFGSRSGRSRFVVRQRNDMYELCWWSDGRSGRRAISAEVARALSGGLIGCTREPAAGAAGWHEQRDVDHRVRRG
jgi:hypothetical protein